MFGDQLVDVAQNRERFWDNDMGDEKGSGDPVGVTVRRGPAQATAIRIDPSAAG